MAGVAAVAAIVGTYVQYDMYQDAKKDAQRREQLTREISAKQAQNERLRGEEEAKRLADGQSRKESETRARIAASGVEGGTQDIYLNDMINRHGDELDWLRRSVESSAQMIEDQGRAGVLSLQSEASRYNSQSYGSIFSGIGDTYRAGDDAGWW